MFIGTIGFLVLIVVNGFEENLLYYLASTYVSSIDISHDVFLEAYLLDVLVYVFGIWLSYILGYVVDELMRW
jgi:hypothetical protein